MSPIPLLYGFADCEADRWLVLDRDGTLTRDSGYTHDPDDLAILPGVLSALQALARRGWGFVIATNQAGLAKGCFAVPQMEAFNQALVEHLVSNGVVISGLAACPHHPEGSIPKWSVECSCRKPGVRMFDVLARRHGFSLSSAVYVGNRSIDREAADAAGIPFYWARAECDWDRLRIELGECK